jgi:prevent-host-death family protein
MSSWQVEDAKARFSELLDAAIQSGPQLVILRGIEIAVLVPIQQWRLLQDSSRPSLKELLVSPRPTFENLVPKRRSIRRRSIAELR